MREVIARLVDGSRLHEFKPLYGTTLVCGFARIEGYPVGILANNGILFSDSSLKGTHFIQCATSAGFPFCFCRTSPALWSACRPKVAASPKMARKWSWPWPIRSAAFYPYCGRLLWSWQLWHVRTGVLPAPALHVAQCPHLGDGWRAGCGVLFTVKQEQLRKEGQPLMTEDEERAFKQPTLDLYEHEGSPYYSTARLWDDGILDPWRPDVSWACPSPWP